MKRTVFALCAVLIVTGCSASSLLVSQEPQQTIYTLRPVAEQAAPSDALARIVEIPHPSVPPGMERNRIALHFDHGQKLDYYAGALWAAPFEDILQNFTRRTASQILPYVVAVTPGQNLEAQYRLQIKVNDFQPIYGTDMKAAPLLLASLEFTLVSLPQDKIVSSFTLSQQMPTDSNRLDVIVAGLESMLQTIENEAFEKIDAKIRVQ